MSGPIPTPSSNASATGGTPVRYCKKCGYALCGLQSPRCPECGRGFDLGDPRSTRKKPLPHWTRWLWRAGYAMAAVVVLLATAWGWLYWDWRLEQKALAELKPFEVKTAPRLFHWLDKADHSYARWLRDHAGSASFVLDRVTVAHVGGPPGADAGKPTDLSPLAHLGRLETLWLEHTNVKDLSPLAQLTDLEALQILRGSFTDVSQLAGLRNIRILILDDSPELKDLSGLSKLTSLQELSTHGATVNDLSPLAGLTELRYLSVPVTKDSDLRLIAGLTKLEELDISEGTPVGYLAPLAALEELRILVVHRGTSREQRDALQSVLPGCTIMTN